MSKFKGYEIVKKALPKDICKHISDYFLQKRKVTDMLFNSKYQSPFEEINGGFNDTQAPGCFSIYSDINNEVLLTRLRPTMEKVIGKKLVEAYSYCRVYERGAVLDKHKDRDSCEFSTTLNLGGDPWPIFIDNTKVLLKQGDMLVYEGCKYEHWRERFDGVYCTQVFLHYVDEDNNKLKYDGRPMLGLPAFFKGRKLNNDR
jgi:hypothetical protein